MRALGAIAALAILASCTPVERAVPYLIGVSQANLTEPWRISMTDEIRQRAAQEPNLRVVVADASDSLGKQIGDVETFEGLGIDLLIISPLESEALTPTVSRVFHKIPVIVLNRSVANDDYTLFIGPDNARIGQEAGRFVAQTLRDRGGTVLEVLGRSGSPPTLERAQAFRAEASRNPRLVLASPVLANWLRDGAEDLVGDRLRADAPPQVIFAHNDAMAWGAWKAARSLGLEDRITFVGVDGLAGPDGGQDLLLRGVLKGTFLSPTGGREAVEYALDLLAGSGVRPKKVILGTKFLTRADLVRPEAVPPPKGPRRVLLRPLPSPNAWARAVEASVRQALGSPGWDLISGAAPGSPDPDLVVDLGTGAPALPGVPLVRVGVQPPAGDDGGWILAVGPDAADAGHGAGLSLGRLGVRSVTLVTGPAEGPGGGALAEGLARGLEEFGLAAPQVAASDGTAAGVVTSLEGLPEAEAYLASGTEELEGLRRWLAHRPQTPAAVWVLQTPAHLGPLVKAEAARALGSAGVSRRVLTEARFGAP